MSRHRFEAADLLVIDGVRRNGAEPQLHANLPGVLRGEGIFETFLILDGEPTRLLHRHQARLERSAQAMGMDLGQHGLAQDLHELLPLLPPQGRWRVRYTVLRGLDRRLLRMWTAGEVQAPPAVVDLLWSRFRQDPLDPLVAAKTTSRAGYQVAHAEAVEAGCFEALLPTIDGDIAECTAANVFCWQDGALRTPASDRGILAGVTRELLLEACAMAGIPAYEQEISQKILCEADEVFISNAVIGLIPVARIQGLDAQFAGLQGTMLPKLRAAYAAALPDPTPNARQET